MQLDTIRVRSPASASNYFWPDHQRDYSRFRFYEYKYASIIFNCKSLEALQISFIRFASASFQQLSVATNASELCRFMSHCCTAFSLQIGGVHVSIDDPSVHLHNTCGDVGMCLKATNGTGGNNDWSEKNNHSYFSPPHTSAQIHAEALFKPPSYFRNHMEVNYAPVEILVDSKFKTSESLIQRVESILTFNFTKRIRSPNKHKRTYSRKYITVETSNELCTDLLDKIHWTTKAPSFFQGFK